MKSNLEPNRRQPVRSRLEVNRYRTRDPELGQEKEEKEGGAKQNRGDPQRPGREAPEADRQTPNPPGEASPTPAGPGGEEVSVL